MLTLADKKTLFQDRYQALLLPVPTAGTFRQRHLLHVQKLYPAFYAHISGRVNAQSYSLVVCYNILPNVIWRG